MRQGINALLVVLVTAAVKKHEDLSAEHAALRDELRDVEYKLRQKCDEVMCVEKNNASLSANVAALRQRVAELEAMLDQVR